MAITHVRVTLDKPAEVDVLVLRYGTEDATLPQQMVTDDYVNDVSRAMPRVIPGKPITWSLAMGEPVVMPAVAAMHYFGNWDIPEAGAIPGYAGEGKVEVSYNYEKRRVGRLWGDYGTMTRSEAGGDGRPRGYQNLPRVKAPPVPHVTIELLDANFAPTGMTYRPHERFRWDKDLSKQQAIGAPQAVQGFSHADMSAMVERMVAERLDELAGSSKKAKAS